jgi:hypothetical protein
MALASLGSIDLEVPLAARDNYASVQTLVARRNSRTGWIRTSAVIYRDFWYAHVVCERLLLPNCAWGWGHQALRPFSIQLTMIRNIPAICRVEPRPQ